MMCWVAFDRAIRLGEKRSLEGPFDWMQKTRDPLWRIFMRISGMRSWARPSNTRGAIRWTQPRC
ncbi:MAG TPA: hypothetical protein VGM27_34520 [Acidobacteriaceae bacterium]